VIERHSLHILCLFYAPLWKSKMKKIVRYVIIISELLTSDEINGTNNRMSDTCITKYECKMFYNLFLFSYSWCPQVSVNQYLMQMNKTNWLQKCCQFLLSQIIHVSILNICFFVPSLKFLIYSNIYKSVPQASEFHLML